MWKQSVCTSTISSHLAALHLKPGGLLTLTGAKACLGGTPGKISEHTHTHTYSHQSKACLWGTQGKISENTHTHTHTHMHAHTHTHTHAHSHTYMNYFVTVMY